MTRGEKAGEGVKGVVEGAPKVATDLAHARKGVQLVQAEWSGGYKTVVMVITAEMVAGGCVDRPGWVGVVLEMLQKRGGQGGGEADGAGGGGGGIAEGGGYLGVLEVEGPLELVVVWGC